LLIFRTDRFKKAWKELEETEKALAAKVLQNLLKDFRYPGLGVKKIQGAKGIWEARVSRTIRLTFHIDGDSIVLRNIGKHDNTLSNP
jgi:mRNA interferase RelE/StbE